MATILAKIGDWVKVHRQHLWLALVLALVGWSTYNLGVIRGRHGASPLQEAAVFRVRESVVSTPSQKPKGEGSNKPNIDKSDTRVVVSKSSSSKKYHHAWCASGTRIKEANRVWFPSAAAAQAAGYSLAGNCKE